MMQFLIVQNPIFDPKNTKIRWFYVFFFFLNIFTISVENFIGIDATLSVISKVVPLIDTLPPAL